mgnify:CR=1 FL=1
MILLISTRVFRGDSTNVERPGYTMSERIVGKTFDRLFTGCKQRIIVTTFARMMLRRSMPISRARFTWRRSILCSPWRGTKNRGRVRAWIILKELLSELKEVAAHAALSVIGAKKSRDSGELRGAVKSAVSG